MSHFNERDIYLSYPQHGSLNWFAKIGVFVHQKVNIISKNQMHLTKTSIVFQRTSVLVVLEVISLKEA